MKTFADLNKDELLSALGLETRNTRLGQWITFFSLGMVVGAGVAVMMIPATRRSVIDTLKSRIKDLNDNMPMPNGHHPTQPSAMS